MSVALRTRRFSVAEYHKMVQTGIREARFRVTVRPWMDATIGIARRSNPFLRYPGSTQKA
jgi:hypothetical protein